MVAYQEKEICLVLSIEHYNVAFSIAAGKVLHLVKCHVKGNDMK